MYNRPKVLYGFHVDAETIERLSAVVRDGAGRERRKGGARCGTASGHRRHFDLGEEPCALCKIAKAAYDHRQRAVPENTQRSRLGARAQGMAHAELRAHHKDEYHELYRKFREQLFTEAGLEFRHNKTTEPT